MREYYFKKIDAFATVKSSGNPAGYIWLNSLKDLKESEMQEIAKEMKGYVNEVGFISMTGEKEFDLKYYSSEREVDFCGHATVAILYDIIKTKKEFSNYSTLIINTNRGRLEVENKVDSEDAVYIMSPAPLFSEKCPKLSEIVKNLNIAETEINTNLPISVINAGLSTLIVPIKNLTSTLKINPEFLGLKEFCFSSNIDIIIVFTDDVYKQTNDYRTRVFAPTFGYLEDPATGSGNSALGYYLIQNKLWENPTINIEQNGIRENFNKVNLLKKKDENEDVRVCFGGGAKTRIEGKYRIYSSS